MNESIKQKLHELELKELKIQELECERERIKKELEYVRETTRNLMEMKLKLAHSENPLEETSEQ